MRENSFILRRSIYDAVHHLTVLVDARPNVFDTLKHTSVDHWTTASSFGLQVDVLDVLHFGDVGESWFTSQSPRVVVYRAMYQRFGVCRGETFVRVGLLLVQGVSR